MDTPVKIFDTTLRDGEQSPGCSMDLREKLEMARALDRLRVDVIEAGFAVSSPGDFESVQEVSKIIKNAQVASLSRAVRRDIEVAYDAVRLAQAPRIHTFLATSDLHLEYKLKKTREQALEIIRDAVGYARSLCPDVEFSAEDATRSDPVYLAQAVRTALAAGATVINIPDTVGYAMPDEMTTLIRYLREAVPELASATLSVHCHDDLGMGVANSLAAVAAGANQVECTINGIGERAGNAALEEIVMGLHTRKNFYGRETRVDTTQIYRTSRMLYSIIGMSPPPNKAIVGGNAFAHESGIHQHGVLANRATYEIMTPQSVGLTENKMVLGKHSGRHAVESRLAELGIVLAKEEIDAFFERFKALADKKKAVTDSDLEALSGNHTKTTAGAYALDRFTVNSGNYVTSNAVVRLSAEDGLHEGVAIGDGPIDAAFNAIDALTGAPAHTLDDYAIHSISEGRDALGEVVVRLKCGSHTYTGRGLSTDIIEASIIAYVNGINKMLAQEGIAPAESSADEA